MEEARSGAGRVRSASLLRLFRAAGVVSTVVDVCAVRTAGAVDSDAGDDGGRLSSSHLAEVILLPFCVRWSNAWRTQRAMSACR